MNEEKQNKMAIAPMNKLFWKMLKYNEKNEDEVEKVNIEKCFVYGGLLFGLYLVFVFISLKGTIPT